MIRTLDIGGDKVLQPSRSRDENSFMGFRAIRFCLENIPIFKAQLRAILRASACRHNIKLMYPMISGVLELRRANAVLEEVKADLKREDCFRPVDCGGHDDRGAKRGYGGFDRGGDRLSRIGTNDLIQYMVAADRLNDQVAHLYDPSHPAVLRTLNLVITGAKAAGRKPVSICGEIAGDPVFAGLLLGMGADSLSMAANILPEVKYFLRNLKSTDAAQLAEEVLAQGDSNKVEQALEAFRRSTFGGWSDRHGL